MPRQTRRFVLRDRTSAAHAMVESLVGTLVSLEAYRCYVAGMQRFRAPVEAGLSPDFSASARDAATEPG